VDQDHAMAHFDISCAEAKGSATVFSSLYCGLVTHLE